jgi:O-antigen ligase
VRVSGPFPLAEIYSLSLLICYAATLCWHRLRRAGWFSIPTAIAVVELAAIGITYFRAAWLGALVVTAFAFAYVLRARARPVVGSAILIALVLIAFGLTRFDSVSTRLSNSDNVIGRLATWGQDLNVFATAPVFGVGVERFTESTTRETNVVVSDIRALDQPHSSYLGLLAEQGVVGMLPFAVLTIAVWWLIRAMRRRSTEEDDRAIWACLAGAGLAYLVMSLTLTMLPYGSSTALFALLIGGAAARLDHLAPRGRGLTGDDGPTPATSSEP